MTNGTVMDDRSALLVGIDHYDWSLFPQLAACVKDVAAMEQRLSRNDDGSENYRCDVLRSDRPDRRPSRLALRERLRAFFAQGGGDLLFYYSGHAHRDETGTYMVASDGDAGAPGYAIADLLTLAKDSKAKSKLIILDCCFAGAAGSLPFFGDELAFLSAGVTILSATSARDPAMEVNGHGVFTHLLLDGLDGGAANVRGRVSAAALYGYAEAALGILQQRPFYKSHTQSMAPVRWCVPAVSDALLRELPILFETQDARHAMTPAYEFTNPFHDKAKVAIFDKLKILRNAGLATPDGADDLYWCAINGQGARLTGLGRYYWNLVRQGLI